MLANIPRDNKIFSLHLRVALNPQVIRKTFPGRISSQPKECGVTLVTVTNEPVPRPSATFFAKHFFFSTSWKHRRVPIWLKTLNPKRYAAKYWYRKTGTCTHSRNGSEPNERDKNFFCIKWMQRCQFWCGYKIQIQVFNWQISPGLTQPVNWIAYTCHISLFWSSNTVSFDKPHMTSIYPSILVICPHFFHYRPVYD